MCEMDTYVMADDSGSIFLMKSNKCEMTWTSKLTNLMIEIRLQMNAEFQCPRSKKVELWDYIAEQLRNSSEDACWVTGSMCDTKWRNLMATFRKIKLSSKGNNRRRCYWEFFDILNNAYENNIINEDVLGMTTSRKSRFATSKTENLNPPDWLCDALQKQRKFDELKQLEENDYLDRLEEIEKQKILAIKETNDLLKQLIEKYQTIKPQNGKIC